jgi:hypothetical protein
MSTALTAAAILLEQQAASLPAKSDEMAKQAVTAIIQDLVLTTPVDTGTALSNWQVTLDGPAVDVIPANVPSPKGRNVQGQWSHSTDPSITRQANASEVLSKTEAVLAAKQPGQDVFITNNLDYISILNEGSSNQAPAGFVDRARLIAQSVLDSAQKLS